MGFKYPLNKGINQPVLYEISQETEKKSKSDVKSIIDKSDNHEIVRWEMTDIPKGRTFRIEW